MQEARDSNDYEGRIGGLERDLDELRAELRSSDPQTPGMLQLVPGLLLRVIELERHAGTYQRTADGRDQYTRPELYEQLSAAEQAMEDSEKRLAEATALLRKCQSRIGQMQDQLAVVNQTSIAANGLLERLEAFLSDL